LNQTSDIAIRFGTTLCQLNAYTRILP